MKSKLQVTPNLLATTSPINMDKDTLITILQARKETIEISLQHETSMDEYNQGRMDMITEIIKLITP